MVYHGLGRRGRVVDSPSKKTLYFSTLLAFCYLARVGFWIFILKLDLPKISLIVRACLRNSLGRNTGLNGWTYPVRRVGALWRPQKRWNRSSLSRKLICFMRMRIRLLPLQPTITMRKKVIPWGIEMSFPKAVSRV